MFEFEEAFNDMLNGVRLAVQSKKDQPDIQLDLGLISGTIQELLESRFERKLKEHYPNGVNSENYKIDYLSVCNWNNGHVYGTISTNNIYTEPFYNIEKEQKEDVSELCLSTTVRVGGTRLLDNLIINIPNK